MCYLVFDKIKNLENPMNPPKKFSWSWTKLKNFRSCPKRHYHLEIAKDIREEESEAILWGKKFHDAMAKRIDKGTALPPTMSRYERWPALMYKHKLEGRLGNSAEVKVELKLAMDEEFRPTEWFDGATWFRAVVDVLYLAYWKAEAAAIDWKTGGKIEPEFEQLALTSQVIFAHHPDIEKVHTAYQWAAHDTETLKAYTRDDMMGLWNKLLPEVRQMEEAARTLTYPPKPSGLCIRYCPVVSCPHHGRGSR
jgi:PD-(D/E)XK nuclease superfamily